MRSAWTDLNEPGSLTGIYGSEGWGQPGSSAAGTGRGWPPSPPMRSSSAPTPLRSPSASTARQSCCPPQSAAPSSHKRSGSSCPDTGPAFPLPRRPSNGRGCGNSRPSAPTQTGSGHGHRRSEARKHGRRAGAAGRGRNVSTFGVVWLTAFTGGGLPISWMRPSTASGTVTMTRATMPVGGFPPFLVLCQACCNSLDAWEVGQV